MVRDKFTPLFTRLDEIHRRDPENQPRPSEYFNWHALRHFGISCWIEADLAQDHADFRRSLKAGVHDGPLRTPV